MKQVNADDFKNALNGVALSEWIKDVVCEILDDMPAANEQPEILYQSLIPLNPRSKKNNQKIVYNQRTRKPMVMQGDIYKQYEQDCGWFLKPPAEPIDCPVNVRCVFYRDTARRCDLTNLLEAIDDILVKYKVIADDNFNIIAGHDGSRVYIDRFNPRTEITIERA